MSGIFCINHANFCGNNCFASFSSQFGQQEVQSDSLAMFPFTYFYANFETLHKKHWIETPRNTFILKMWWLPQLLQLPFSFYILHQFLRKWQFSSLYTHGNNALFTNVIFQLCTWVTFTILDGNIASVCHRHRFYITSPEILRKANLMQWWNTAYVSKWLMSNVYYKYTHISFNLEKHWLFKLNKTDTNRFTQYLCVPSIFILIKLS